MNFDHNDILRWFVDGEEDRYSLNQSIYDAISELIADREPLVNSEDIIDMYYDAITNRRRTAELANDTKAEMDGNMPELDTFLSQFQKSKVNEND